MSKKEEFARKYRLKAKLNTERYLEGGSNIEKAYIAGWDAACEDADGVRGHIKLWKEEFLDRAAEFIELYILNHDNIDIFEMEEEFIKAMEE